MATLTLGERLLVECESIFLFAKAPPPLSMLTTIVGFFIGSGIAGLAAGGSAPNVLDSCASKPGFGAILPLIFSSGGVPVGVVSSFCGFEKTNSRSWDWFGRSFLVNIFMN